MTFEEYIPEAMKTAVFTDPFYPFASLIVESAELLDVFVKPLLRGDNDGQVDRDKLIKEAGDCYWNLAAVCQHLKLMPRYETYRPIGGVLDQLVLLATDATILFDHEGLRPGVIDGALSEYYLALTRLLADYGIAESEVLEANLEKLRDRAARGVLKGSGGDR